MEMRANEDIIAIAQDLTPPLPPLAFALHDSALSSHCSACFSHFTPPKPHNPQNAPTLLYCSPHCSSLDSPLHSSSAEPHLLSLFRHSPPSTWHDSSDLRLALRLLHIFSQNDVVLRGLLNYGKRLDLGENNEYPFGENGNNEYPDENLGNLGEFRKDCGRNYFVLERIAGLMTNREMLVGSEGECENVEGVEEVESVLERIREGAEAMAVARGMRVGEDCDVSLCSLEEEMAVLCLVLTNAVEVQDESGGSVGVAVYGAEFSWINHSCAPNACYRFSVGLGEDEEQVLRIYPAANGDDAMMKRDARAQVSGGYGYGPRVIVRSVKTIRKAEEVTIAYTDLLQPKEMRQAELWYKYKFRCCCKRCSAVPATYVDCSLQAVCTVKHDRQDMNTDSDYWAAEEIKKLTQGIDDAITDYLSYNKPKLCCEKLENFLTYGKLEEQLEHKALQKLKLHPFHHVSLNAYTALASAYKVCASDLLALDSATNMDKLQAFNMCKASAAYSLLLAGVSNHLFMFESSLLPSVANSWTNVGDSLMNLSRSALWDSFLKPGPVDLETPPQKCEYCSLADVYDKHTVNGRFQNIPLEAIYRQQSNCIADMTTKVWTSLTSGSSFLKSIKNPISFSWLESAESFSISNVKSTLGKSVVTEGSSRDGAEDCTEQLRKDLTLLSVHCSSYGELLSSICYGFPKSIDMYRDSS